MAMGLRQAMEGGPQGAAPEPNAAPPAQGGSGIGAAMQGQPRDIEDDKKRFVGTGMLMLYDESFMAKAEAILSDGENTVEDMASLGSAIALRIYMAAKEKGNDLDPAVVLQGGFELMDQIGQFATETGVEVSPEDVETAYLSAADRFRQQLVSKGLLDEQEMAQQAEEIQKIIGPDQLKQAAMRVQDSRNRPPKSRALAQPAPTDEGMQ